MELKVSPLVAMREGRFMVTRFGFGICAVEGGRGKWCELIVYVDKYVVLVV